MVDELKFAYFVVMKVVLPRGGAITHVNGHAKYALYQIMKKVMVNPTHLIWDFLISFPA